MQVDQLHWNEYFMLEFIKKQTYRVFCSYCFVLNFYMLKDGNGRRNCFRHENGKIFKYISNSTRDIEMTGEKYAQTRRTLVRFYSTVKSSSVI